PPARFRRFRHRDIPPHRSLQPTPNPDTPSSAAQNSEARFRLAKSQTPRCPSQSLNAEIPFCHLPTQLANRAFQLPREQSPDLTRDFPKWPFPLLDTDPSTFEANHNSNDL